MFLPEMVSFIHCFVSLRNNKLLSGGLHENSRYSDFPTNVCFDSFPVAKPMMRVMEERDKRQKIDR